MHASGTPSHEPTPVENVEVLLDDLVPPISWRDVFGNDQPVAIDVGCGKGRFIIEASEADPHTNYFGIEFAGKPYFLARDRIARQGILNAKVLRADARKIVGEYVPKRSVTTYHVLFPDPWPKKRHHRRRVVTPRFVEDVASTLVPSGAFQIATDVADYFEELVWIIESTGLFGLVEESLIDPDAPLMTNFSAKYVEEGRTLYRARFELTG